MAVRTVLQLGDPLLREVCAPVPDPAAPEVAALVADLADTLAHWRRETGYGRGIAAPQIGVLARVVFLQLPGREPWPLVNPEIVERSAETLVVWDACLSFLAIFLQVERHREITVRYQDLEGGFFGIVADDSAKYDPGTLPAAVQKDGLRVRFTAKRVGGFTTRMWGTRVEVQHIEPLR